MMERAFFVALASTRDVTSAGRAWGVSWRIIAIAPATNGAAIEVPLLLYAPVSAYFPANKSGSSVSPALSPVTGHDDLMLVPGAKMSTHGP